VRWWCCVFFLLKLLYMSEGCVLHVVGVSVCFYLFYDSIV